MEIKGRLISSVSSDTNETDDVRFYYAESKVK